MVNALGFQGKCAVVLGHLRARLVAGKTAFLDARSAQRVGWKGLVFPHDTRNSCPTIDVALTRFSATTCNRRPGPLLDVWTGFSGVSRAAGFRPNAFEHTRLAPSRKAVSGRVASRPACLAGLAPQRATPECALGKLFRPEDNFRPQAASRVETGGPAPSPNRREAARKRRRRSASPPFRARTLAVGVRRNESAPRAYSGDAALWCVSRTLRRSMPKCNRQRAKARRGRPRRRRSGPWAL